MNTVLYVTEYRSSNLWIHHLYDPHQQLTNASEFFFMKKHSFVIQDKLIKMLYYELKFFCTVLYENRQYVQIF